MRTDGASITIVGRAATNPMVASGAGGADRVTLRVVSTERRFDEATGSWVDGDEFGANVVCWRAVAAGVLKTVRKGDPVVVTGRISTRRFERNGVTEYFTDAKADTLGFDVGRAKDRIRRSDTDPRVEPAADPTATGGTGATEPGGESAAAPADPIPVLAAAF